VSVTRNGVSPVAPRRCVLPPPHAETMKWAAVDATGEVPARRSAHSTALVDGRYLYVFGGWDGQEELGDLHVLDTGVWACHIVLSVCIRYPVRPCVRRARRWCVRGCAAVARGVCVGSTHSLCCRPCPQPSLRRSMHLPPSTHTLIPTCARKRCVGVSSPCRSCQCPPSLPLHPPLNLHRCPIPLPCSPSLVASHAVCVWLCGCVAVCLCDCVTV
jgi:hypothetical protein